MYQIIIQRLLVRYFLGLFALLIPMHCAFAEHWNLPQQLSPANSSITFEVDSTWHLIKGTVKELSGKLWLSDSNDFQSVRGEIRLPISAFDTDNGSRDEKLRVVMNAKQYPDVEFAITAFDAPLCNPETLLEKSPCQSKISGNLTINNTTKKVDLKTSVEKIGTRYQVVGTTSIKWSEFNVADPSIIIAKLYEDVKININLTLSTEK